MVSISSNPPDGFGDAFLEWLLAMNELLDARILEAPGIGVAEVNWLEHQLGVAMPVDFRTLYRHCNPWGIWSHPQDQWKVIRQQIASDHQLGQNLLPVDINSQAGNYQIAMVMPDGSYELWQTSRFRLTVKDGDSLRDYFLAQVEAELRNVERSLRQRREGAAESNTSTDGGHI